MTDSFYRRDGADRWLPTDWTLGPWGRAQHGGPPSALLGRVIESQHCVGKQVARIAFDILRPVPMEPLTISTRVLRSGQKVSLAEASLSAGGETVMRATAWLIREAELDLPRVSGAPKHPGPEGLERFDGSAVTDGPSYLHATEWRFVRGDFLEPGPAVAWLKTSVPLVEGEEDTPLTHVLAVADSASGVSGALDFSRWVYINTDVSVYLHRLPVGPWICIDAETFAQPTGVGLASASLYDEEGGFGTSSQSLYIAPR